MKIVIDEGHNRGQDQGSVAIGNENTMNVATGDKVITKLKTLGHDVLDVISQIGNDVTVSQSLSQRVSIANNWGADLYVSIHANAGGGTGTEVWIGSNSSKDIATKIVNNIAALGYTNRGVKVQGVDGGHLYVLNNTKMPALLVEQCFVDRQGDMANWDSEAMANAIVKGITGQNVIQNIPTKGWYQESGIWYYNENKAKVINSWRKDSKGLWYFLGGDGAMVTNRWIKSNDGKWYYLGSDGAMLVNTKTPDGYFVDSNGVWDSKSK